MYAPKYAITNKILRHIGIIEAAKEVIDHAPLLPYYEKEFRKDALVRTVHHGTHIEGNELDIDQAEKVLSGGDVVARDRDIQEVINYRSVMEYINQLQISNSQFQISNETIRHLHQLTVAKILPPEKCGVFRTTQVVIKNSLTQEVTFRPPAAAAIPFQIEDLLAFMNVPAGEDIHPILLS